MLVEIINSFITHFLNLETYSNQGQSILMHVHNYEQFNTHFHQSRTNFNVPPFSKIALWHISLVVSWSGLCLIIHGTFFTACLHILLVLIWSATNLSISRFLSLIQHLFLKTHSCLDYIHYQQFYINYNKKVKEAVLTREIIKVIFL